MGWETVEDWVRQCWEDKSPGRVPACVILPSLSADLSLPPPARAIHTVFVAVIGWKLGLFNAWHKLFFNKMSVARVVPASTLFDGSFPSSLFQVPNQSQPQLTDNPMPTEISEAIRHLDDR